MNSFLTQELLKLYKFLLREEASSEIRSFFVHLGYVAFGFGVSTFFFVSFQVLAGRFLGPIEYGKYALVQSVALFLYIPMYMGIGTAVIKYVASTSNEEVRKIIISTSYLLTFGYSLISCILLLLFADPLSHLLGIPDKIFLFAILFALSYSTYTFSTNILRCLSELKRFAFVQGASSFLIFLFFFVLWQAKIFLFEGPVYATMLAYLVMLIFMVIFTSRYFSFTINLSWAATLATYGLYATAGAVSYAVLTSLSKIIINMYLSAAQVGIYNAYSLASTSLVSIFSGVFIAVFFPVASGSQNRQSILEKGKKLFPYLAVLGIPVVIAIQWLMLLFYGREYPIDLVLMIGLALTTIFMIVYGFYAWLFAAEGMNGMRITALIALLLAVLSFFLHVDLIARWGLYGAPIASGVSYLIGILGYKIFEKRIL